MNGEAVNDALFERNAKISDRFDIVMTETEYSDEGFAATNVLSGNDTFSLMNVRCTKDYNRVSFFDTGVIPTTAPEAVWNF